MKGISIKLPILLFFAVLVLAAVFSCSLFSAETAYAAEGDIKIDGPTSVATVYGTEATLTVSASGEGPFIYEWYSEESGEIVGHENVLTLKKPSESGNYYCIVRQDGAPENFARSRSATVTITPLEITAYITPNVTTAVYGEPEVDFSGNLYIDDRSLAYDDEIADLGIELYREAGDDVGVYAIRGRCDFDGYSVRFAEGRYNIVPKPIAIVVSSPTTTYGDPLAPINWELEDGSSLAYDDTPDDLGINLRKAEGTDAGRYPITGFCNNGNYAATFRPAVYTIAPITVEGRLTGITNLTYSGKAPQIGLELLGDAPDLEVVLTFNKAVKNADDYVAYARLTDQNYRLYASEYPFTIEKAPLTIGFRTLVTTADKPIEPEYFYLGFAEGEDESVLTTMPTVVLSSAAPGRYEVMPGNATADNYEISYRSGIIQINIEEIVSGDVVLKGSFEPESGVVVGGNNDRQLAAFKNIFRIPVYSLRITGNMYGSYTAVINGRRKGFPLFQRVAMIDANGAERELKGFGYNDEGNFTFTAETPGILVIYYDVLTPAIILVVIVFIILFVVIKRKADKKKYKRAYRGHYIARQYAERMVAENPATRSDDEE